MAMEWIKMRMGLRSHPKIVRMSSALNADRFRVIGGLHAVWCLADEHSEDGNLPGYSLAELDNSIGWAGFSQAMKDVQWLTEESQRLVLPRFDEHNGQSAKRRAMESERKRNARKPSARDADKKRTREEKRRTKPPVSPLTLPAGVSEADWQEFREHRSKLRKPMTPRAEHLALDKLTGLVAEGYDAKKTLNHAIEAGWQTFYARDDCRASAPTAATAGESCPCGDKGTVRVGGKWRCAAHTRTDFSTAAKAA